MSPLLLLLTIPAFATRFVATILDRLLPIAGPLTVPIEGWVPLAGLGHSPRIIFGPLGPPDSVVVTFTTVFQYPFSAFVLAAVDFGSMLDFPAWTDTVFSMAGLVLLVLGVMAWLGSHSGYRRAWGRRMAFSGGGLFVVGTAFGTFVDLLQYVLG
ncbi:hypothetical protein [Halorarius halobius]|uniref:hypothetical protein n=1 Tax=Halorarius halobius TaxID=2962671 RepID=UPI0020CCC34B|nr:hypothetical protein [Halorarius halobius]